jgi:hypothetical protein
MVSTERGRTDPWHARRDTQIHIVEYFFLDLCLKKSHGGDSRKHMGISLFISLLRVEGNHSLPLMARRARLSLMMLWTLLHCPYHKLVVRREVVWLVE